jgi:acylphosphatase
MASDGKENRVRVHALISGRVQGVCYRLETRSAARARSVNGWVRNLADGRVEAVFEGTRRQVDDMVAWCRQGPPAARVAGVEVRNESPDEPFDAFEITG